MIAVEAGGALRYPPDYTFDENISQYDLHLRARLFAMTFVAQALTVKVDNKER